jgi:hypothetical protein
VNGGRIHAKKIKNENENWKGINKEKKSKIKMAH